MNMLCSSQAAMRFGYFVVRLAWVHLAPFLMASRLLCGAEGLAVGLTRPTLGHPPVKQRWIVLELQQCRSNFLHIRHSDGHGIKASFLVWTSGIGHVSQPLDISIAHMKSHLAHIQHISIIHLPRAGEGNDAPQITSRGVFSVGGI